MTSPADDVTAMMLERFKRVDIYSCLIGEGKEEDHLRVSTSTRGEVPATFSALESSWVYRDDVLNAASLKFSMWRRKFVFLYCALCSEDSPFVTTSTMKLIFPSIGRSLR